HTAPNPKSKLSPDSPPTLSVSLSHSRHRDSPQSADGERHGGRRNGGRGRRLRVVNGRRLLRTSTSTSFTYHRQTVSQMNDAALV
ncbi:hypothetical protein LINPERPRIM_LOCUS33228, partial [Linum perenne]